MIEKTTYKPKFGTRKPLKRKISTLSRSGIKRAPRAKQKPPKKVKKKAWKFKKTELAECDAAFAREIRERDGECLYPDCHVTENLTCSHYIGRANWNTRFSYPNCIALCIRHHFMDRNTAYEFQKARVEKEGWDGQYTLFMKRLLGEENFKGLLQLAEANKTRKEAIIETQKKYNLRQPEEFSTPAP